MVRRNNVLHQFAERRGLPLFPGRAGSLGLLNFPHHGFGLESLGNARLVKRLLSTTTIVQAMAFERSNGVE